MNDFDKLKDLINKTNELLKEPEPGMISWHGCLNDNLKELAAILVNKGYCKKKN